MFDELDELLFFGDVELELLLDGRFFGIFDEYDLDFYGVYVLEVVGLEIYEVGIGLRLLSEVFLFNLSFFSFVFGIWSSMDNDKVRNYYWSFFLESGLCFRLGLSG